jgi:hypothetical protein
LMLGPASSREPVFHLIGEQPPSKIMIGFKGASLPRLPHVDGSERHRMCQSESL